MKRIAAIAMITVLALSGCGTSKAETASSTVSTAAKDFDGSSQSDTGNGTITLVNESGNGNSITVFAGKDDQLIQIELDTKDLPGDQLSHIYIDGIEVNKQQLGTSQTAIDLKGDSLKTGTHKVEVVQFTDDDPAKDVTVYKTVSYEVKSK